MTSVDCCVYISETLAGIIDCMLTTGFLPQVSQGPVELLAKTLNKSLRPLYMLMFMTCIVMLLFATCMYVQFMLRP